MEPSTGLPAVQPRSKAGELPGPCLKNAYITFKRHNDIAMVIIIYLMIVDIENTYICGLRSCRIFSAAILPRIFLDFPFSRKVLWEQVTSGAFSVSLSVPIENRNFEGMLALPLTP